MRTTLILATILASATAFAAEEPPLMRSETVEVFEIPEANQGIGVDAEHFYAVDNRTVAKYRKDTKALVAKFEMPKGGPIQHFDSAEIVDGQIILSHSNYPVWPMTSSVEILDAATMSHVDSHSFGIDRGSLTWLSRDPEGRWWGTFANYNRVFDRMQAPYGNKYTTQVVRFTPDWQVAEAYVIPDAIVEKFDDMSNSGGSWGPDGRLYITGHDPAEAYVMEIPAMGSTLDWVATVPLEIRGQGIAWDRTAGDIIYGIIRGEGDEPNRVSVNRIFLDSAPEQRASAD